ncbi:uncharacterized protein A4U43_C08F410 [Asparagus officinalis]|uniref:uncharacterized protein LOC109822731 n=1 Tax=Asparagus officinalis TaxID=4686 RepID=UPI00098E6E51|nr:uncharacterized protein LOC109822731 [Asparagus officinalis]ONK58853.1 uncharacterized protein A4U43_C08F410 [Asparagus officinalis]
MHSLSLLSSLPLKFSINPSYPTKFKPTISIGPPKCSSSSISNESSFSNEAVSGMVDELLKREENKELLDGLNEASKRVERAREAMAEIERREAEAVRAKEYVAQLENRKLEIEKSQRELLEARAMVDEAQRSLSSNMDENSFEDAPAEEVNKDKERLESIKAASISAIIGTLASLPISLYQDTSYIQLSFHLAIIFSSCALFGVTYRYIVRRDLDDIHLKTGASAAFGFVKGLAALGAGQLSEVDINSLISYSVDGAVYVSQSVFIFLSASVALDFCFKTKLLSPFPIREVK